MTEREQQRLSMMMMSSEEILLRADARAKDLGWEDLPHFLELCVVKLLAAETVGEQDKSYQGCSSLFAYETKLIEEKKSVRNGRR